MRHCEKLSEFANRKMTFETKYPIVSTFFPIMMIIDNHHVLPKSLQSQIGPLPAFFGNFVIFPYMYPSTQSGTQTEKQFEKK